MKALREINGRTRPFLLGASPWNVNVSGRLDFHPGWEQEMERLAGHEDRLRGKLASDFLVYPRGFLQSAPELVVGRCYVDNGLMWWARQQGASLIDGTPGILTCHQNHEYDHLAEFQLNPRATPGARWNLQCVGGSSHLYTWVNATHHYTRKGLRRNVPGTLCRWSTHPHAPRPLHFFSRVLGVSTHPLRRALGLLAPPEWASTPVPRASGFRTLPAPQRSPHAAPSPPGPPQNAAG